MTCKHCEYLRRCTNSQKVECEKSSTCVCELTAEACGWGKKVGLIYLSWQHHPESLSLNHLSSLKQQDRLKTLFFTAVRQLLHKYLKNWTAEPGIKHEVLTQTFQRLFLHIEKKKKKSAESLLCVTLTAFVTRLFFIDRQQKGMAEGTLCFGNQDKASSLCLLSSKRRNGNMENSSQAAF